MNSILIKQNIKVRLGVSMVMICVILLFFSQILLERLRRDDIDGTKGKSINEPFIANALELYNEPVLLNSRISERSMYWLTIGRNIERNIDNWFSLADEVIGCNIFEVLDIVLVMLYILCVLGLLSGIISLLGCSDISHESKAQGGALVFITLTKKMCVIIIWIFWLIVIVILYFYTVDCERRKNQEEVTFADYILCYACAVGLLIGILSIGSIKYKIKLRVLLIFALVVIFGGLFYNKAHIYSLSLDLPGIGLIKKLEHDYNLGGDIILVNNILSRDEILADARDRERINGITKDLITLGRKLTQEELKLSGGELNGTTPGGPTQEELKLLGGELNGTTPGGPTQEELKLLGGELNGTTPGGPTQEELKLLGGELNGTTPGRPTQEELKLLGGELNGTTPGGPTQEELNELTPGEPTQEQPTPVKSPGPTQEQSTPIKSPELTQQQPTPKKLPEPTQEQSTHVKLPGPTQEQSTPIKSPGPTQQQPTHKISSEQILQQLIKLITGEDYIGYMYYINIGSDNYDDIDLNAELILYGEYTPAQSISEILMELTQERLTAKIRLRPTHEQPLTLTAGGELSGPTQLNGIIAEREEEVIVILLVYGGYGIKMILQLIEGKLQDEIGEFKNGIISYSLTNIMMHDMEWYGNSSQYILIVYDEIYDKCFCELILDELIRDEFIMNIYLKVIIYYYLSRVERLGWNQERQLGEELILKLSDECILRYFDELLMDNELNNNNNDVAFILSNGYLINLILCSDIDRDEYRDGNATELAGEGEESIDRDKYRENATELAGEREECIPAEDKLIDDELIDELINELIDDDDIVKDKLNIIMGYLVNNIMVRDEYEGYFYELIQDENIESTPSLGRKESTLAVEESTLGYCYELINELDLLAMDNVAEQWMNGAEQGMNVVEKWKKLFICYLSPNMERIREYCEQDGIMDRITTDETAEQMIIDILYEEYLYGDGVVLTMIIHTITTHILSIETHMVSGYITTLQEELTPFTGDELIVIKKERNDDFVCGILSPTIILNKNDNIDRNEYKPRNLVRLKLIICVMEFSILGIILVMTVIPTFGTHTIATPTFFVPTTATSTLIVPTIATPTFIIMKNVAEVFEIFIGRKLLILDVFITDRNSKGIIYDSSVFSEQEERYDELINIDKDKHLLIITSLFTVSLLQELVLGEEVLRRDEIIIKLGEAILIGAPGSENMFSVYGISPITIIFNEQDDMPQCFDKLSDESIIKDLVLEIFTIINPTPQYCESCHHQQNLVPQILVVVVAILLVLFIVMVWIVNMYWVKEDGQIGQVRPGVSKTLGKEERYREGCKELFSLGYGIFTRLLLVNGTDFNERSIVKGSLSYGIIISDESRDNEEKDRKDNIVKFMRNLDMSLAYEVLRYLYFFYYFSYAK